MDTEELILLIHERESLWNQKSPHYHSRDAQRRLWNEVAEQSEIKVEEVKKKWRGLRDIFRREFKKATGHRSDDTGEEYIPKWPYYKNLLFLKDALASRDLTGSVPSEVDEHDEHESDLTPEYDNESSSQIPSPQIQMPSSSKRVFKSPQKRASKRLKEISTFDEKLLQVELKELQVSKGNMADSEMQFLMSLHPFLKQVPLARQLAVRANIMQALMDETTPQYSPKPAKNHPLNGETRCALPSS